MKFFVRIIMRMSSCPREMDTSMRSEAFTRAPALRFSGRSAMAQLFVPRAAGIVGIATRIAAGIKPDAEGK
jgi:hypothetical protein